MKRLLTRLLLVMSAALMPVLAFQIYAESDARRVREQLAEDEAISLVRMVSAEQLRIIEGAEQVLDTIGGSPDLQDGDSARCHRLLANLVATSPRYNNAIVIGPDGHLPCAAVLPDPTVLGSDRPYFQEALRTGGFAIGDYTLGRGSGQPTIHIAKAFKGRDGAVIGVAVVALNLDWLAEQVEHLSLPPSAVAVITDRKGTILVRRPEQARFIGAQLPPGNELLLEGDRVGVVAKPSLDDGRPLLVGYSPVDADVKGLSVRVGLDRETTFAAVTRANWTGLMLICLGAALALLQTALLGSRLIAGPVNRLLAAAETWRGGDLTARTGLTADRSEFGRLGIAFDGMAVALEQREGDLRRINAGLETRVGEEVAAREAAQARAAHGERMQALGKLAGGIAHDFNNVLQAVEGALLLIERESGGVARIRRLIRMALEATERGASVTRRLLAFGRRGDLRAEAVDPAALLAGLRELLSRTLGAGTEVAVSVDPGVKWLLADKELLETVLVNLATNARDAMPGGGSLTLHAAAETFASGNAGDLAPGRYVRLTVADTGSGMDAATLLHAGEPFFTTKTLGEGTGLGLAMAKGFVAQSGGQVAIESAPGQGTTVTLWLPEADAAESLAESAPAVSTERLPARVLLVDDEVLVREMLAEQLEDEGLIVTVAANGSAALDVLDQPESVDILVTDFSMPGMDGLALIRAAHTRLPGLPAVLLTGYSGDGVALAVESAAAGKISLLRKPIRAADLADRVQVLLAARETVAPA